MTAQLYTLTKLPQEFPSKKINTSADAAKFVRSFYANDIEVFESFFILALSRSNDTIGFAKISQGGTAGTVVDLKIIAKYAVDMLAGAIILVHNHPSGNLRASEADKNVTQKTKKGLALLDIPVLDHIILSRDNHFSFADNALM